MLDNVKFDLDFGNTPIGVDEVGRGCWCGPVVVCAAVILDYEWELLKLINDSKKLTDKKRREIYNELLKTDKIKYEIVELSSKTVDEINVLETARLGMKQSTDALVKYGDSIIADAMSFESNLAVNNIIKADGKSAAVGIASIIAKVHRDDIMVEFDKQYPEYFFASHKGYGTKKHKEALSKHGVIKDLYRLTYKPIKLLLKD